MPIDINISDIKRVFSSSVNIDCTVFTDCSKNHTFSSTVIGLLSAILSGRNILSLRTTFYLLWEPASSQRPIFLSSSKSLMLAERGTITCIYSRPRTTSASVTLSILSFTSSPGGLRHPAGKLPKPPSSVTGQLNTSSHVIVFVLGPMIMMFSPYLMTCLRT